MKITENLTYFPANYEESRKRFLTQANLISGPKEISRWLIPSNLDQDLTVDYLWLPPKDKYENLVVLTCGIHGSETYAGSAGISMFMQELLPDADRSRTGYFIVHAMNPYGFKYHKRCTESGVNLNRNFSVSGELYKLKNEISTQLCEKYILKKPVASLQSELIQSMHKLNDEIYFGDISMNNFVKGIGPGQHEKPQHIEFGGLGPEPQTVALINKMKELIPAFKNIIALDIHTGLGNRGRLHLLTDGGQTGPNPELCQQIFKIEADKEFYEFTPAEQDGFYEVHGSINSLFYDIARNDQKVCSITLEFGTLGHSIEQQIQALNLFLCDHQGQFYGYANTDIEKTMTALNFERSYPNDDKWRIDVVKAMRGLFSNVLSRI